MGNSSSKQGQNRSGHGQSRRSTTSGQQASRNTPQASTSNALVASAGQQAPVASEYATFRYYMSKPTMAMKELYKLDEITRPNREQADLRNNLNRVAWNKAYPNGLPSSALEKEHHITQGYWEMQHRIRLLRESNFWLKFRMANETTDQEEQRLRSVLYVL